MSGFGFRVVPTSVAAAHATPFPDPVRRQVWFFEPTDRAIVLGSTQRLADLDLGEVARRGLATVRRRSGGGAVLIDPAASTWFDVWLPGDDELFDRDVSRSTDWLGELVVDVLEAVGITGAQAVREGTRTRWSRLVCFAALGAGEVVVAGRKAVGISQRRTRAGARFQVLIPHRWDAVETAALFALAAADRDELTEVLQGAVAPVDVAPDVLRDAVERAFSERWGDAAATD